MKNKLPSFKMKKGKACLYVYRLSDRQTDKGRRLEDAMPGSKQLF